MKLLSASDFLRYACGIALIVGSFALLVFSFTSNTVKAAPAPTQKDFQPVGAVVKDGRIMVVGYKWNQYTSVGEFKILAE